MPFQYANNATTNLAAGASAAATTITVVSGQGARFPSPGVGFRCTLARTSDGAIEIVQVTARTTDTLTITRAQEGTTALVFVTGDSVELRLTASNMNNLAQLDTATTFASTLAATGGYNGTVGATTPSTVAATTISTTGNALFGGSSSATAVVIGRSNASENKDNFLQGRGFTGNATSLVYGIGTSGVNGVYIGGATAAGEPATTVQTWVGSAGALGAGSVITNVTTTGLAVTGALSATGSGSCGVHATIGTAAGDVFYADVTNTAVKAKSAGGGVYIQSSAGVTQGVFLPTGLAVTGTLSATGLITATGGQIAFPATQVPSSDANTLDDYRELTYTATATGMTTSPTGSVTAVKTGNMVTMQIPVITGTSNSTTFTLTGMPSGIRPSAARTVLVTVQDNSGATTMAIATISAAGVVTVWANISAGAFTASGTKTVWETSISYVI